MSGSSHVGLATTLGPRRKNRVKRLKDTPFRTLASAYALTPIGETFYLQQTNGTGVYECVRTTTGHQFVGVQWYSSRLRVAGTSTNRDTMTPRVSGALFEIWGRDALKWDLRVVPNCLATADPTLNLLLDPFNPLDEVGSTPTREPNTATTTDSAGTNYALKVTATAQAQQLTFNRTSYGLPTDTYRLRTEHIFLGGVSGAAASWRLGNNSSSGFLVSAGASWATTTGTLTNFANAFDLGFASATSNTDGVVAIANVGIYDSIAGDDALLPTFAQELAAQKAGHMKRDLSYAGTFSLTNYNSINVDGTNSGAHLITVDPAGISLTSGYTLMGWFEPTEVSALTQPIAYGFDNHASFADGASGSTHGQIGVYGTLGANTTGTATRLGKLFMQPNSAALASTPCPLHYFPNQGKKSIALVMSPNGDGSTATHKVYINGIPLTITAAQAFVTAPRVARMLVGAWNASSERRKTLNGWKGNVNGLQLFPRALSDAEVLQQEQYMIEQLRLDGDSPAVRKACFIFEGDSRTAFSPSWAFHISDCTNLNPRLDAFNVAVGGTGMGGAYYTFVGGVVTYSARYTAMLAKLAAAASTYEKVVVVVSIGTNEYQGATDPPHPWGTDGSGYPAWRTDYINYIASLKAVAPNVEVWHCTLAPVINVGGTNMTTQVQVETVRHAYNDDMRANYRSYGIDRIIELGLGTERMTGVGVFTPETIPGGRVMNDWRYCNGSMTTPQVGSGNRSPSTTLTLSAASGTAITATAGAAGTFLYHDVARKIVAGAGGYGIITAVSADGLTATLDTSNLVPTAWTGEPAIVTTRDTVTRGTGYDATSYISGAWSIRGNGERWNASDGLHELAYGGREQCDYVAPTFQAYLDTLNGVVT